MQYDTQHWITRRWKRKSDNRFYSAVLAQDIFGNWIVTRTWGGNTKSIGHSKTELARHYESALTTLAEISKRRKQRRYCLIENNTC